MEEPLAQFRAWVWRDAALQAQLSALSEEGAFVDQVVQAATERNFPVTTEAVRRALSYSTPSLPIEDASSLALAGWIPTRLKGEPPDTIEWCWVGSKPFTEPFFEQTVRRAHIHPFNRLFRLHTSRTLSATAAHDDGAIPLAGFIFHLSRCGSTLAAQLLARLPRHLVLSEAEPIDTILRAPMLTDGEKIERLRELMRLWGQPRSPETTHLFVKFDSWHLLRLPLIRRAFPTVPWLFLYRDPIEIMVSHRRRRGSQMVPGLLPAESLGLRHAEAVQISFEAYGVHLLARLCEAALVAPDGGRALSYERLCVGGGRLLLESFGLPYAEADIPIMDSVMRRHAKEPLQPFVADGIAKQAEATAQERALCQAQVAPLIAQLEAWQLNCFSGGDALQ